jgi:hypothetical protein
MAARTESLQQNNKPVAAQPSGPCARKEHPKNRSSVILNQERKQDPSLQKTVQVALALQPDVTALPYSFVITPKWRGS